MAQDDATHAAYEAFLQQTGDAVDALLAAKDIAAQFGGTVQAEISEIVRRIHDLQNSTVPGFQD
jgi:hypothetical protein